MKSSGSGLGRRDGCLDKMWDSKMSRTVVSIPSCERQFSSPYINPSPSFYERPELILRAAYKPWNDGILGRMDQGHVDQGLDS